MDVNSLQNSIAYSLEKMQEMHSKGNMTAAIFYLRKAKQELQMKNQLEEVCTA